MRVILTALILIALIAAAATAFLGKEQADQRGNSSVITTENLMVYRNAVVAYADAAPTATGPVSSADLALPAWFKQIEGINGLVQAGASYVWFEPKGDLKGLADALLQQAGSTALAGYKRDGKLFSPRDGLTAVVLPSLIPDGALVYYSPAKASTGGGSGSGTGACGAMPADVVETRPGACPVGSTGPGWTQSRTAGWTVTSAPTCYVQAAFSEWSPASAPPGACDAPPTCGAQPADTTETREEDCPGDPSVKWQQTRVVTHTAAAAPACWVQSFNSWMPAVPPPGACPTCGPKPAPVTRTGECPAGQYGSTTEVADFTAAAHPTCWTQGAWTVSGGSCTACPANGTEVGASDWVPKTEECPAGEEGSITYEVEVTKERTVSYSCPAGTAAAPSPIYGAWVMTETANRRNEVNTCKKKPTCAGTWRWVVSVEAEQSAGGCPSGGGTGPAVAGGTACAEGSPDRTWRTCGSTTAKGTNYWDRTATCVCQ